MPSKLTIRFGVPEHGCLPVRLQADDFRLQFEASDVPVNSLEELCSALILAFQGIGAQTSWHLEPVWYHFRFAFDNELVALYITEQQGYAAGHTEIIRLTGSVESIVLPFYRALRSFTPPDSDENWSIFDSAKLKKLTALAKEWKYKRLEAR
ncbi:hypothetical protein [Hymenobacter terrestris]|uniref:STAS/SEC14 domain-containing protein n=1 Tax=Hymenobacter terrestris TaxID=2748310 RepID=A0ABX2Q2R5_9BACT|nr:hypothetical protein [Hymenobacter terrestris]NVO85251.1 hypothetical protein [Hymenobacter terrestris]